MGSKCASAGRFGTVDSVVSLIASGATVPFLSVRYTTCGCVVVCFFFFFLVVVGFVVVVVAVASVAAGSVVVSVGCVVTPASALDTA
nr:MAG TPA: hypothetical protein [Caudoviricetes sp.]